MTTITTNFPPELMCDFYKLSHPEQYPEGTEYVSSTWTPRGSRLEGVNEVMVFGVQGFVKDFLIDYFNTYFFNLPKDVVIAQYKRFIRHTMGIAEPNASRIAALHDLGYLPLKIKALKEGTLAPTRVPVVTVENTLPAFYWLTNSIETVMSCEVWMPSTSATIAFQYLEILTRYAEMTGSDEGAIQFQGHDFSMRGMAGRHAAASSGAGHLLSFSGTDTCPAIGYLEKYYNADIENELVGTSIPATEHAVMCANGQDEREVLLRLMTEVYPTGFFSAVMDTWDFWHVIEKVLPSLKKEIMGRDGRVVCRPDSGDPVLILCGDPNAEEEIVRKGLIEALWDTFGGTVTDRGYKQLDTHIGAIYGDSITLDRCEEICKRLMDKGFASTNVVFGIGSFTYQYNTRDTFMFAMKATHAVINGEERLLYKDPKTDSGMKKSQRGLVAVVEDINGRLTYKDGMYRADYEEIAHLDQLEVLFLDGKLVRDETLGEIRARVRKQLK